MILAAIDATWVSVEPACLKFHVSITCLYLGIRAVLADLEEGRNR